MSQLGWESASLAGFELPAGRIRPGETLHLQLPWRYQLLLLHDWLAARPADDAHSPAWLEMETERIACGSRPFNDRVCVLLANWGMLANLSIRENLLLSFLYHGDPASIAAAEAQLPQVAEQLDLLWCLDEQAGERPPHVHALIGLGRVLLLRPQFVIMQEILAALPPERLFEFEKLVRRVLSGCNAGLLYLSELAQDEIRERQLLQTLRMQQYGGEEERSIFDFDRSIVPGGSGEEIDVDGVT